MLNPSPAIPTCRDPWDSRRPLPHKIQIPYLTAGSARMHAAAAERRRGSEPGLRYFDGSSSLALLRRGPNSLVISIPLSFDCNINADCIADATISSLRPKGRRIMLTVTLDHSKHWRGILILLLYTFIRKLSPAAPVGPNAPMVSALVVVLDFHKRIPASNILLELTIRR